jgi:RNA polymerase sigma-70 factor (ECF subfamily)
VSSDAAPAGDRARDGVANEESSGAERLRALFDTALPAVYGYLIARCGGVAVAEDLTAETFLAAADAVRRDGAAPVSTPWLIGVARHKLVDHWRRQAREERSLRAASDPDALDDPWDVELDALRARATLGQLAPHHRAALTLRYLDDLPVPRVAELLDRSVHSAEGLLVRARAAFRRAYAEEEAGDA